MRQENGLMQEELAKKVNTARSNIANYENDKNMPSVDILEKLSEILGCSIDYLLGKTDKKKNTTIYTNSELILSALEKLRKTMEAEEKYLYSYKEIAKSVIESLLAKQEQEKRRKI